MQQNQAAILLLEDGTVFKGIAIGIDRKGCAGHGNDGGDLRHENAPVNQKPLRFFAQKNGM